MGQHDSRRRFLSAGIIMLKYSLIILFLTLAGSGCRSKSSSEEQGSRDTRTLDGAWNVIRMEVNASTPDADNKKKMLLIIENGQLQMIIGGVEDHADVRIDDSQSPKTIDFTFTSGENKGKTIAGIFRKKDDQLDLCLAERGQPSRPTDFHTRDGDGRMLFTLARISAEEAKTLREDLLKRPNARLAVLQSEAKYDMRTVDFALNLYRLDHGQFPKGNGPDVLSVLTRPDVKKDGTRAPPHLETDKMITDPWGNRFYYEWPTKKTPKGERPAIWSAGPNGKNENGEGDDIRNW